jgi:hypothetical protein
MGFLSSLFGGSVIKEVGDVADKLFTSDKERLEAANKLEEILQQPDARQVEVNKVEAVHSNIFVSGARPFILWVCGFALAAYYLPQFVIGAYLWGKIILQTGKLQAFPIEPSSLLELVGVLLGASGLRTFEKVKKVASS